MTSRLLFLARHGETAWNSEQRWQGQTDIALNATGRAQAAGLAARLAGHGIGQVYASDLSRARETAEIAARHLGIAPVTFDAGLRERGYGVFEGLTREECEAQQAEEWARYLSDRRYTPVGGELEHQVVARMQAAVARAGARPHGHDAAGPDAVLIVSHGGALRALIAAATGWRPPPMGNADTFRMVLDTDGNLRDPELIPGSAA